MGPRKISRRRGHVAEAKNVDVNRDSTPRTPRMRAWRQFYEPERRRQQGLDTLDAQNASVAIILRTGTSTSTGIGHPERRRQQGLDTFDAQNASVAIILRTGTSTSTGIGHLESVGLERGASEADFDR